MNQIDYSYPAFKKKVKRVSKALLRKILFPVSGHRPGEPEYNYEKIEERVEAFSALPLIFLNSTTKRVLTFMDERYSLGERMEQIIESSQKLINQQTQDSDFNPEAKFVSKHEKRMLLDPTPKNIYRFLLFVHSHRKIEDQYREYIKDSIEIGKSTDKIIDDEDKPRIEWLGTQRDLGELFVELAKKGWIKEINSDVVQILMENFTKTKTLHQIMKKGKDDSYDQIYSNHNLPFSNLKHNSKNKK